MTELVPNILPIEAGPIIISENRPKTEVFDTHLVCEDFMFGALANSLAKRNAELAMLFTVRTLIVKFNLAIISPRAAVVLKNGDVWGPYKPNDYYIDRRVFLDTYDGIIEHVKDSTDNQKVVQAVEFGRRYTEENLDHILSIKTIEEIPGAAYSESYPTKHIELGNLLAYSDFADCVYAIGTSSSKVASVFDSLVLRLGDEMAVERLMDLGRNAHPTTRLSIRESLFIKTQGLADLILELSEIPETQRPEFNNLSLSILNHALGNEDILQIVGDMGNRNSDEDIE